MKSWKQSKYTFQDKFRLSVCPLPVSVIALIAPVVQEMVSRNKINHDCCSICIIRKISVYNAVIKKSPTNY